MKEYADAENGEPVEVGEIYFATRRGEIRRVISGVMSRGEMGEWCTHEIACVWDCECNGWRPVTQEEFATRSIWWRIWDTDFGML